MYMSLLHHDVLNAFMAEIRVFMRIFYICCTQCSSARAAIRLFSTMLDYYLSALLPMISSYSLFLDTTL